MTSEIEKKSIVYSDPDLLQIIGSIADVLGLSEHMHRLIPLDRLRSKRRHRRTKTLKNRFKENLEGARVSLKAIKSILEKEHIDISKGQIAIAIPRDDLPVYRKALEQLQISIRKMTNAAYELEELTSIVQEEAKGYYRISEAGEPVLQALKGVFIGAPDALQTLLSQIETYLSHCSSIFTQSDDKRIF